MAKLMNNSKGENIEIRENLATKNNIVQQFKMDIYDGKGLYETGVSNTFWSRLIITAKIFQPQNGVWKIKIRDKSNKNVLIYDNYHVLPDSEISFNYKTGLVTNFIIEASWNQSKDTILTGEISIRY